MWFHFTRRRFDVREAGRCWYTSAGKRVGRRAREPPARSNSVLRASFRPVSARRSWRSSVCRLRCQRRLLAKQVYARRPRDALRACWRRWRRAAALVTQSKASSAPEWVGRCGNGILNTVSLKRVSRSSCSPRCAFVFNQLTSFSIARARGGARATGRAHHVRYDVCYSEF